MARIATLTMNPAIDVAYTVPEMRPVHKLRCHDEQYDPGGGGINVARVLGRFGHKASCYYLSGGHSGAMLDRLLLQHALERRPIPISGNTRICFNVIEESSAQEFRFVPEGPLVSDQEWQTCLHALESAPCDYLVASGSLPRGVPADFYARLGKIALNRGFRLVLDSSGDALREGLAGGNIHVFKPSDGELAALVGRELSSIEEIGAAAMEFVTAGKAQMVAVTMGAQGGLFADRDGPRFFAAPPVRAISAVGAGDSAVAGMVHALAQGKTPLEAFRFGQAAGTAAVLTPGTDMCVPRDVERIYRAMTAG